MSNKIPRLPDAELEVMMIIWESESDVTSAYVMEKLTGKKSWTVTTVLNFLSRLIDRGFLSCKREGRINIYTPIIDEKTYIESESKSFLEKLHGNSIKNLVTSLLDSNSISTKDLQELKDFINDSTKED